MLNALEGHLAHGRFSMSINYWRDGQTERHDWGEGREIGRYKIKCFVEMMISLTALT